jgi:mRNA interferase MazF
MASRVNRGEIWLYDFGAPDKRRPVLVLSRKSALTFLRTALVAPITSAAHGAPSEVQVGPDEGLKHESVVTLDHVQTVEQRRLHQFIGTVGPTRMAAVCRALMIATGCGDEAP